MKIRSLVLSASLFLLALPALADGIAGKWNVSIDTPNGPFPLQFEFAADGSKLTGSMGNQFMPTPIAITDGVVKGNDVMFKLAIPGPDGNVMGISYRGVLKGDELSLISKFDMPPPGAPAEQTLLAKRAK